jgi:zinc protease
MAVIAVGDFDKAAVENAIRQDFASLPAPASPKVRPAYNVPDEPGTRYTVATDKEATTAGVTVYDLQPLRDPSTVGAYRQEIVERLFSSMLSARFAELAQKPDAPFLGAGTSRGLFVRTKEATTLGALVKEDGIDRGLEALFTEAERVTRFGFTVGEMDRQKARLLRDMDSAVAEKDKQDSANLAAEFARNFTNREPIPGIVYESALYQRFLPGISLNEVNSLATDWTPDRNRVVVVTAPEKAGLVMPDQPKLAAAIASATAKELKPYVDAASTQPLLDPLPAPGAIAKTTPADAFGITAWELSNGVKVVLKPTTFKEDEILFRATSLGGTSLASDKDFVAADTAGDVIPAGGLGAFSVIDLRKALAGKAVSVQPMFGETDQGLSGGSSRKDLETMFQLIYLSFTTPRADATMFGVLTTQMRAILANQKTQPEFAFNEVLESTLSQDHVRARPLTAELVDEMSLEKSLAFYKERFADASGFTFTFIGSFDLPTIKPLVERYLGSLPALHRHETWKDVGMHPPTGVIAKKVEKGIEPKSQAAIVFTGPFAYNQPQRVAIRAMAQVLETRLRETLREDLGGTYSVTVGPAYTKIPRQEYRLEIDFGCSPARTDELVKTVFQQIELLKSAGPTDKQVSDVKETFLRDAETNSKQNGYLVNQISLRYEYGEDVVSLFNISEYYNKITATIIQDAAKTYLNISNSVTVTLFPEKK